MGMTIREAIELMSGIFGLAFLGAGLFLAYNVNSSPLSRVTPEVTQMFTYGGIVMIVLGATMVAYAILATRNSN